MSGRQLGTLALLITLGGCEEAVILGPGVHAPAPPLQNQIDAETMQVGDFQLRPQADFSVTAKVLSKRRYRFDELASVAPWDFALGWGPMSDEAQLRDTKVTQGGRKMYWHLYDSHLQKQAVEQASANMHLIPASDEIEAELARAIQGSVVRLDGVLVDLVHPDGRVTPTSLTRNDYGAGACEILLVREVTRISGSDVALNN